MAAVTTGSAVVVGVAEREGVGVGVARGAKRAKPNRRCRSQRLSLMPTIPAHWPR